MGQASRDVIAESYDTASDKHETTPAYRPGCTSQLGPEPFHHKQAKTVDEGIRLADEDKGDEETANTDSSDEAGNGIRKKVKM